MTPDEEDAFMEPQKRQNWARAMLQRLGIIPHRSAGKENMTVRGHAELTLRDAETGEVERTETLNALVDDGRNDVLAFIGNLTSTGSYNYCAVGTDGTATSDGDSSLNSEVERIIIDDTNDEWTADTAAVDISGTFTFGTSQANNTLEETGLFSASSGGTMFNRAVISPAISKDSSQTLEVSWTISFA